MRDGNARVKERFVLALDGMQIASVVVGALVALGAVFALGLSVGQHLGSRRAEAVRPADLSALDAVPAPAQPTPGKDITFAAELPKAKPPAVAPPSAVRPVAPAPAESPAAPAPAPAADAAPPPSPAAVPAPAPAAAALAKAAAAAPAAGPGAKGAFSVQLGASQRREEAEALAHKVQKLSPRIEEADIPGKGRFFRVRVGRFDSRGEAEKYRGDVARETGIQALIVAAGN
ncbi:MAG TPA: SPOR domain-containing protein [Anaeromyxobacter sp.]|nr:SPOR domain-containing protein [Anaeromyxobacter sp.]